MGKNPHDYEFLHTSSAFLVVRAASVLTLSSVEDAAHEQLVLPPSLPRCLPLSFLSRSSLSHRLSLPTTSATIPTYLLSSHSTPPPTQRRYSSTVRRVDSTKPRPYRTKTSQTTHRRITSPSLQPEQAECIYRAKALGLELTTPSTVPTPTLSHLTSSGTAHMISITSKHSTHRTATAVCTVLFSNPNAYTALSNASLQKGDAIAVARVAGIMAAKKTADLIPLAHPGIGITGVSVDVELFAGGGASNQRTRTKRAEQERDTVAGDEGGPDPSSATICTPPPSQDATANAAATPAQSSFGGVSITTMVECEGKTGVEMEALAAASVAGLTVYDMCKGVDKGMVMQGVRVVEKTGGKSGDWVWPDGGGGAEVRQMQQGTVGQQVAYQGLSTEAPGPLDEKEKEKLVAMSDAEFVAEVRGLRRKRVLLAEAKLERDEEARKPQEAVRMHVAKREEEIQRGTRGRVEQERLERAWLERRRQFENSSGGTVVRPDLREMMAYADQMG